MGAKQARRVRSTDHGETDWRRWLQPVRESPIHAWIIAFVLALGLALCEADLLIQLFWQRRLPVQVGLLMAASVLQTALLLGHVRSLLQERLSWDAAPAKMVVRWIVAVGIGASVLALIWTAGLRFQLSLQATAPQELAIAAPKVLDPGIEWTFLALLAFLLTLRRSSGVLQALTAQQRMHWPLYFLAAGFALVYLVNTLLPMLDIAAGRFRAPAVVPAYDPVGMDFRRGLYLPATRLVAGQNIYPEEAAKSPNVYPPLVTLMGTAFVLLSEERALTVHALVLFAANVMCLLMAIALWRRSRNLSEDKGATARALIELPLLVLVGVALFSGFPFLFSFERGNIDVLAMLLALGAFLVLASRPERMWLQIVLLSLAIHIKAYPALLLLPLFIVHRRRMLLPSLLVNVALLLCLGPTNAIGFVNSLVRFYKPIVWVGNHSAYSFAGLLAPIVGATQGAEWALRAALIALPLIVCGFGLRAAIRQGGAAGFAAAALVLTTPVMAVLPGISYDYQLVILYGPIFLLLAMIVESMKERQEPEDYVLLLLVMLAASLIGRSYMIMPGVSPLLQNKYVWLMLIELTALAQVLRGTSKPKSGSDVRRTRRASVGD